MYGLLAVLGVEKVGLLHSDEGRRGAPAAVVPPANEAGRLQALMHKRRGDTGE